VDDLTVVEARAERGTLDVWIGPQDERLAAALTADPTLDREVDVLLHRTFGIRVRRTSSGAAAPCGSQTCCTITDPAASVSSTRSLPVGDGPLSRGYPHDRARELRKIGGVDAHTSELDRRASRACVPVVAIAAARGPEVF